MNAIKNIPEQVRQPDTMLREFLHTQLPGLETSNNPVTQQIAAGKPPFAMPNDTPKWSEAIADTAYFRLAWSLAPPSETTYERFCGQVLEGTTIFRRHSSRKIKLAGDFMAGLREAPLYADLDDRKRNIQGNFKDEAILNGRFLCAAALANYVTTPARQNAHYKDPLLTAGKAHEALSDFVPDQAKHVLNSYLTLSHSGPVDKELEPWGEGPTFDKFRDRTHAAGTRCIFYQDSFVALTRPWLVADGTLLGITTTRRTQPSLHKTLRMLAGFVLADTADQFGIKNVAWYHAPSGQFYEQPVDSFFDDLGANAEVAELRERFTVADARKRNHAGLFGRTNPLTESS